MTSPPVRYEVEVVAGHVLELQRPLHAVCLPPDHDERGQEADYLEILGKLLGVPHLAMLRYQGLSAAWLGVDFGQPLTAGLFRPIGHSAPPPFTPNVGPPP